MKISKIKKCCVFYTHELKFYYFCNPLKKSRGKLCNYLKIK